MTKDNIAYYGGVLLIAAEVCLIVYFDYALARYFPIEMARYISMDVLFCLPIFQAARFIALRSSRRSDPKVTTFIAILLAFIWSATEVAILWPDFPMVAFAWNTFTRGVVFTVIGRILVKLWREREYSRKDVLTGLANRRELVERLAIEQSHSKRSEKPYSLLFIDVDNFKEVNDVHGHQIGDEVLTTLSEILVLSTRKVDVVARLGGDEFVVLLPETDEPSCDILIERIESTAKRTFEVRCWPISISIGRITHTGITQEVDWVIDMADRNMYETKRIKQQMLQGA